MAYCLSLISVDGEGEIFGFGTVDTWPAIQYESIYKVEKNNQLIHILNLTANSPNYLPYTTSNISMINFL